MLYPIETSVPALARLSLILHRDTFLRSRLQEEAYGVLRRAVDLLGQESDPRDAELVALALREYRPRREDDHLELLLALARRLRATGRWQDAQALQTLCSGPRFAQRLLRLGVLAKSAAEVRHLLGLAQR